MPEIRDKIHVESFELSPRNEAVMTTIGRLRRTFPGPGLAFDRATFEEAGLQDAPGPYPFQMSRQSVAETMVKIMKAEELHDEDRHTTDSKMVTEFLMSVLRPGSVNIIAPQIHRCTREEVMWLGSRSPWRRSALWLFARVVLQIAFRRLPNGERELKDDLYKQLITFTREEQTINMMDRRRVMPLLPESYDIWNPGPELNFHVHRPRETEFATTTDLNLATATWACVNFPQLSLNQLKSWATMTKKDPSIPFVSTVDTVCAFLWKCISRVRLSRLDPSMISTISRAVDIRNRMGVPGSYLGVLQSLTFARRSLQQVVDYPLGVKASYLRSLLDPDVVDLVYQARALNTFVARAGEKKITASFTANVNPTADLMTSSWSKIGYYDYDFNLGLGGGGSSKARLFLV
ncbi:hypothetical protein N7481_012115 [Penicillium waksmanii]|uniref:uncharacterized protein n=1 Tax=Penicillium waksmanii TaxID=69791 RepID=UPI0025491210|nr:uncharacterized protein N7481_012115 [Penicillium waksmanii]KAJ5965401.1 hypothetical protein N7481_012115 [Penicillium waksmanii]